MSQEKPLIFISHAHSDRLFAELLRNEINKVFANGVETFVSSVPGNIPNGDHWIDTLEKKLEISDILIVLVSQNSMRSSWVWFEMGYFWTKKQSQEQRIIPICLPDVIAEDLPTPLNSLQTFTINNQEQTENFIDELCIHFKFGNKSQFEFGSFYKMIKYYSLNQSKKSRFSGTSDYDDFSDEDLSWLIRDALTDMEDYRSVGDHFEKYSPIVERSVVFSEFDLEFNLPLGSARRLLVSVANHKGYVTKYLGESLVVFEFDKDIESNVSSSDDAEILF